ncbi:MAG TPA: NAD(P)-dependent oxidoreductase [Acidimicrobiales bacterium]|jgi:3-hydroxyisobutyrate dehydrogenase|nr:NAD(P)-dependent oxidoreductase [Acidimicrobiales bacterium]
MGQTQTIAVLGTGIMGAPMARNLARAGFAVRAWNRTREKAASLHEAGIEVCDTPGGAVAGAACAITMVGDADAVEAVMLGPGGALEQPPPGLLWLQCATVGVQGADHFASVAQDRDVAFVDAPVLGTRKPAEDGTLTVLASGAEQLRERCQPVFDAVAQKVLWVGAAGAGSRLKLVVNNWVLAVVTAVSESLALAEGLGLDPTLFLSAIEGSQLDTPYAHLKGRAMINREFPVSFPAAGACKDAGLIVDAIRSRGVSGEVAEAVLQKFEHTVQEGHGDADMAAAFLHSLGALGNGS